MSIVKYICMARNREEKENSTEKKSKQRKHTFSEAKSCFGPAYVCIREERRSRELTFTQKCNYMKKQIGGEGQNVQNFPHLVFNQEEQNRK